MKLNVIDSKLKELRIGNQIWSKKNLAVTKFRNGEDIPIIQGIKEWDKMDSAAMYISPQNEALYNWFAVNDERGLAPEGWHVPSDSEWQELVGFLWGERIAGRALKWEKFNGDNSSKFKALPTGFFAYNLGFVELGLSTYFWCSSGSYSSVARKLSYDGDNISRVFYGQRNGFSVRCIKD